MYVDREKIKTGQNNKYVVFIFYFIKPQKTVDGQLYIDMTLQWGFSV